MSYLIIPSAGGTCHRRVDLGAIAALFVEEEPLAPPPPGRLARATAMMRAVTAPLNETLGLLRDEALARKIQTRQSGPRAMRAFGI